MQKQLLEQKGRTILEVMFVVSILGIIGAGIYGFAAQVISKRADVEAIVQLQSLAEDVKNKFAWLKTYKPSSGTLMEKLSADKIISNYSATDKVMITKNSLKIKVLAREEIAGNADKYKSFIFEIQGVPPAFCATVLESYWQDLMQWSVSLPSGTTTWNSAQLLPLRNSEAISYCKNSRQNIVKLKFM